MKLTIRDILDTASGFVTKHEKFIFITLARILALGCLGIAIYFVWKLSGQLSL